MKHLSPEAEFFPVYFKTPFFVALFRGKKRKIKSHVKVCVFVDGGRKSKRGLWVPERKRQKASASERRREEAERELEKKKKCEEGVSW